MSRLLLVRHCEAASTADTETRALSERGYEQAQALAIWLRANWAVDQIVSSPYRRAIETIAPFAALAGLEVAVDARLRERETSYLPTQAEHIAAAETCFADHSLALNGAETGLEAQTRGWDAIEAAIKSESRFPLLVSHGQLLSFSLARLDGSSGVEIWRAMSTPDVFLLEKDADGPYRFERVWAGDRGN